MRETRNSQCGQRACIKMPPLLEGRLVFLSWCWMAGVHAHGGVLRSFDGAIILRSGCTYPRRRCVVAGLEFGARLGKGKSRTEN